MGRHRASDLVVAPGLIEVALGALAGAELPTRVKCFGARLINPDRNDDPG